VLASLPLVTPSEGERPPLARRATWLGHEPTEALPPLRLLLIWDNLAGHWSWSIIHWLLQHGIMPLDMPLSGSWLTMAESIQRILVRHALDGQQPQSQDDLITWLDDTVAGWNADPTPSSGMASATSDASALDSVVSVALRPRRLTRNYLRRDPQGDGLWVIGGGPASAP